jgi:ATP-dependent helicase/nuclease subunit B
MNRPILIPPGHDIVEEIVSRLRPEDKDYSRSLIVFPGKRPGHYLRKKIGSLTGTGYIPPRIMSMDEFVDYMYEKELGNIDRKIDQSDAAAVLFEIHRSVMTPIGGEYFKRIDNFLPLAMNIFRELEEFCMGDVTPDRLRETVSGYDTGQIGALESYYSLFYTSLAEREYSTRSVRYRRVAHSIKDIVFDGFSTAIFAGFYVLTKSERDIFWGLLNKENTLVIFQDGIGMQQHLRELRVTPEKIEGQESAPVIRFHKSPDTHGQIFSLTGLIKNLLDKNITLDERTVIVTPESETLFPLLQHTLPLIPDNNYNISLGYPAVRSTLNGFLSALYDSILSRENGRYYTPDYLRFVLHPYTKNIYLNGSSEPSRILFHTIEDHFTEDGTLTFFELPELESDVALFEQIEARATGAGYSISAQEFRDHIIRIHNHTLRFLEHLLSIGEFAQNVIDIILYLNNESPARQHPLFNHFSGHMIESLLGLRNSLLAGVSFGEPKAYFNFYNHFMQDVQIPFAGTPLSGVQVLGFLETRSLRFDRVFLLDANDDVISGQRNDESLIPTRVRNELGLPTYRDRERLYAYYLDLLIRHAREVDCFYIEKDKKERSRYLERIAWQKEKTGEKIQTDSVQYTVTLTNSEPSPISKTGEMVSILRNAKFSATSLDMYLKCQLKFYYRYVLRLFERDELAEEIDNLQIGSIVHRILKRYFVTFKGRQLRPEDLSTEELLNIVQKVFIDTFGDRISGKVYLLRRQISGRMEDYLNAYQIPAVEHHAIKIVDVETSLSTNHRGFTVTGTIDRIEKRDDRVFILDYKISAHADRLRIQFDKLDIDDRSSWYDAIGSLQLPVYTMLYENNFPASTTPVNPLFILLGKQRLDKNIEFGLYDMTDNPATDLELIKDIITKLLSEIVDPSIDFQPTQDFTAECPQCAYKYICGTQWTG